MSKAPSWVVKATGEAIPEDRSGHAYFVRLPCPQAFEDGKQPNFVGCASHVSRAATVLFDVDSPNSLYWVPCCDPCAAADLAGGMGEWDHVEVIPEVKNA